jgi:hypothetical protein
MYFVVTARKDPAMKSIVLLCALAAVPVMATAQEASVLRGEDLTIYDHW